MLAPGDMPSHMNTHRLQGILAALLSAVVLGLSPVFGKQAINAGTSWLTVVMLRTVAATGLLWFAHLAVPRLRRFAYIYPVGLLGCLTAGLVNGLGSLMYYNGLGRLDASLAQLIYMMYPLFMAVLAWIDGYAISRLTLLRLGMALAAVYLLVGVGTAEADLWGVAFMLGGSVMFALHLVINQRMLQDMPAPTVTLYTLTAMAGTVFIAYLIGGLPALPPTPLAWQAVSMLTFATLASRLMLFMGIKRLGGVQAVLLTLSELLITVVGANLILGELLSPPQWLGAILLGLSVLLVLSERGLGVRHDPKPWLQIITARFARAHVTRPASPPPRPKDSNLPM